MRRLRCSCDVFDLVPLILSAVAKMSSKTEAKLISEKHADDSPPRRPSNLGEHLRGRQLSIDPEDQSIIVADQNALKRDLKGRHMQMIAM